MTALTAIVLDTETTTNKDTPDRPLEVVELAWMPLAVGSGFMRRYKPTMPCALGATAVHHILPEDLEGCPPSSQARKDVPEAEFWIGHNIDFDWKALGEPHNIKRICTLALSRYLWPECDSHTLSAMIYFIKGTTPETRQRLRNAHAATDDCVFVLDLLDAISKQTGVTKLQELYALSEEARIPQKWTFGKFADQPIASADRGYVIWFKKNCTDRPDYQHYLVACRRAGLLT